MITEEQLNRIQEILSESCLRDTCPVCKAQGGGTILTNLSSITTCDQCGRTRETTYNTKKAEYGQSVQLSEETYTFFKNTIKRLGGGLSIDTVIGLLLDELARGNYIEKKTLTDSERTIMDRVRHEWRQIIRQEDRKNGVKEEKEQFCVFCGKTENLELHHINYTPTDRKTFMFCKKCHEALHGNMDKSIIHNDS